MKETTEEKEKYLDALKIYENINKGLLKVKEPSKDSFIESLEIKGGEAQVLMLYDGFS